MTSGKKLQPHVEGVAVAGLLVMLLPQVLPMMPVVLSLAVKIFKLILLSMLLL